MAENSGEKFKIAVPYTHPMMVADRKKEKISSIAAYFFMTVVALIIGAVSSLLIGPYLWVVFGIFAAVMVFLAVRKLLKDRPTPQDGDRKYDFYFTEDGLQIRLDDTVLNSCSYNNQSTQWVAAIYDVPDRIKIQLVTGEVRDAHNLKTRNIYKFYSIPKAVMAESEPELLKEFLQAKLGKRYKSK